NESDPCDDLIELPRYVESGPSVAADDVAKESRPVLFGVRSSHRPVRRLGFRVAGCLFLEPRRLGGPVDGDVEDRGGITHRPRNLPRFPIDWPDSTSAMHPFRR